MSKQDWLVILIVIVLGGVLWLVFQQPWQQIPEGGQASITVEGQTVAKHTLQPEANSRQFTIQGKNGTLTLETKGNAIRIAASPCPDQTCVKTGWVSKTGQAIVCVPNHVVVEIQQAGPSTGLDAVTY